MPRLVIEAPELDAEVTGEFELRGSHDEVEQNTSLRVFARREGTAHLHPISRIEPSKSNGHWSAKLKLPPGACNCVSHSRIALIVTSCNKSAEQELATYLELADNWGRPGLRRLPNGCRVLAQTSVTESNRSRLSWLMPWKSKPETCPDDNCDTHSPIAPKLNCADKRRLKRQWSLRRKIDPQDIVCGDSPALLTVFEQLARANATPKEQAVLLMGETGVGKTMIAQLIHQASRRAGGSFRIVNAASAGGDPTIQRGEWLGYSKGHGIQGIDRLGKPGHLVAAQGGTLFIDEFDLLSREMQGNLLSVLEGRDVELVGGSPFTPNVRCIFATNADIESLAARRSLRPDLLARIGAKIRIPALRERQADILPLTRRFAVGERFSARALLALLRHDWPCNVRQLATTIQNAIGTRRIDRVSMLDLAQLDLPIRYLADIADLEEEECLRELWITAQEIAQAEGYHNGKGLQRRTGEILGVTPAYASRMHKLLDLTPLD